MRLIDYICKASGWTPVSREDEGRAYRIVAKCEGTPAETLDKLEAAIGTAKKSKKINWDSIDGLIASLRLTCSNAVAIANADAAWDSSSLYC